MTANWFEVKVKYTKVDENGRQRKVSELYLLDAVSFTEAESRIIEELRRDNSGRFLHRVDKEIQHYRVGRI